MQYNGKHKNQIFWALATSLELAQQHEQHKNVVFLVSSHDGGKEIGGYAQKNDLRPKKKATGHKEHLPSEGCVPCALWAEPNYPSVINEPAATRPNAIEKFMTEATSMVKVAILIFSVKRIH